MPMLWHEYSCKISFGPNPFEEETYFRGYEGDDIAKRIKRLQYNLLSLFVCMWAKNMHMR